MSRRKPQTTNNNTPTCTFRLMRQKWIRIALACRKNGMQNIADSIEKHIEGVSPATLVEIKVPISACVDISQACANHGVSLGLKFVKAATLHLVEKVQVKSVPSEAMENAQEALEEMDNEK